MGDTHTPSSPSTLDPFGSQQAWGAVDVKMVPESPAAVARVLDLERDSAPRPSDGEVLQLML